MHAVEYGRELLDVLPLGGKGMMLFDQVLQLANFLQTLRLAFFLGALQSVPSRLLSHALRDVATKLARRIRSSPGLTPSPSGPVPPFPIRARPSAPVRVRTPLSSAQATPQRPPGAFLPRSVVTFSVLTSRPRHFAIAHTSGNKVCTPCAYRHLLPRPRVRPAMRATGCSCGARSTRTFSGI